MAIILYGTGALFLVHVVYKYIGLTHDRQFFTISNRDEE